MAAQELVPAAGEEEVLAPYKGILRWGLTQLTITNLPSKQYLTYPLLIQAFSDSVGYWKEMEKWDLPVLPMMDIFDDEVVVIVSKEFKQKLLELKDPITLGGKNLHIVCSYVKLKLLQLLMIGCVFVLFVIHV